MSYLYFNKENDYSVENTNENEDLHSTILYSFQFEPKQKKTGGNESHDKKKLNIFTLQLPIDLLLE